MAGERDPLGDVLGAAAESLSALAPVLREKVLTGLESLTANRPTLEDVSFGMVDADGLSAELSAVDHIGMELTLSTAGEKHLGALFVPLADLGAMLAIEVSAERMADQDFARAQLEMISAATREFFDLMSMTLFIDELQGTEVVPGAASVGDAPGILGLVVEAAEGRAVVRADATLGLTSGEPARVVLLAPQAFLDAFAGPGIAMDPLDEIASPTLLHDLQGGVPGEAPAPPEPALPLDDADNISTLRPAGTFGAGAREDVDVHPVRFPPLSDASPSQAERRSLDLIMDVTMRVTVELGRTSLTVEEVLTLGPGSVVELNKLAGEPVDVLVNDQLIARGEVVVVDENFGVRVTEIVSPRRRAQAMGA